MLILLTIVHILVCLFLIIVVLLQSGKAGDISSAFGGMGSQTAFGPRSGATLLTRATTTSAILFMVTSLSLTILSSRVAPEGTVLDRVGIEEAQQEAAPVNQTTPQFGPSEGTSDAPAGDAANAPAEGGEAPQQNQ
jgi:preprotein translocase subunit SecG